MTLETSRTRAGRWALLAALAVVAATVACASGGASTAPAGATPAVAAHVGRFVWHDLVTRDAAACQKFYGALLGWDFKETTRDGHPYFLAQSGGSFAGGIVPLAGAAPGPAAWLSYLSVPDLDRAVAQVGSAGGKVLLQPRAVGAYGRVAVVTDPQGAPLGLAGVTGEIPDEPAQPLANQFFWMEYLAKDGPAALAFYKDLAGFDSSVTASQNGIDFHVLKTQGARAGLFQIPSDATMVEPHWLPFVRVADPAALAARVVALGGKVLIAPRAEVRKGTLAVIADPTGGAVALQKWPL
jgi:predicted enzyme related to lactoylglutathione lyase